MSSRGAQGYKGIEDKFPDLAGAAEKSLREQGFNNAETRGEDWAGGFYAGVLWLYSKLKPVTISTNIYVMKED